MVKRAQQFQKNKFWGKIRLRAASPCMESFQIFCWRWIASCRQRRCPLFLLGCWFKDSFCSKVLQGQQLFPPLGAYGCGSTPPFFVGSLVLLSLLGSMFPLSHRSAARRLRSTLRPSFHPLTVDPLAIVLVEESSEPQLLEEGEFVPNIGSSCLGDCG
ncbi:hypothetical protein AMTR_s00039p00100150 [Amborella trichopoda]|uniref:Uncharacterized protein n=1 Tax=Amborella trichopoda TaxID=13333 RepID=U5D015_AMBTC|nr:hypothetical protein AMTR_s00039p00100150 [Amborella trichopoda]